MVCSYLDEVFSIVWKTGLYDTLANLFDGLLASEELYNQLLRALPTEKQQLLRRMELVTFYTNDAKSIISEYGKILGTSGQDNYRDLESLIEKSFIGIRDVSKIQAG